MGLRSQLKLADVTVVEEQELFSPYELEAQSWDARAEGGPAEAQAEGGTFELFVDGTGLTLHLMAVPAIERRWLWSSVEGFRTTPAGENQEGLPRTSLDLKVDGRSLHLLVPTDQLPARRIAALQKMAEGAAHDEECPRLAPAPSDPEPAPLGVNHPWRYPRPARTWRPGQLVAALVTLVIVVAALVMMNAANDSAPPGVPHVPLVAGNGGGSPPPPSTSPERSAPSPAAPERGTAPDGPVAGSGARAPTAAPAQPASNVAAAPTPTAAPLPTASPPTPTPSPQPPTVTPTPPPTSTPSPPPPSQPAPLLPTPVPVPQPGGPGGLTLPPAPVTVPGVPLLNGRSAPSGGGSLSGATSPTLQGRVLSAIGPGLP